MKKTMIALGVLLSGMTVSAQEISQAVGLRIGDSDGLGYEISYQRPFKEQRLQLDLGLRNDDTVNAYKLSAGYQWVKDLSELTDGFTWFYGAGAGVGHWSSEVNVPVLGKVENDETYALISGTVGIEYNFEFPLQLTLDARPELGFGDFNDGLDLDIALGIRYRFGK